MGIQCFLCWLQFTSGRDVCLQLTIDDRVKEVLVKVGTSRLCPALLWADPPFTEA
jgi:hypothetical protein